MMEFTYDVGVPCIGARISCIFEKYIKETYNVVVVTKSIGTLSGAKEKNIPKIIRASSPSSVLREILNFRPDILIIHQYFGTPFELLIQVVAKLFGIRTIVGMDLADEHAPTFKVKSPSRLFRDVVLFVLMTIQLSLADKVFCRTKNEVNLVSKLPVSIDKFEVIPVPLPSNFKIGTSKKKKSIILAVSGWWSDRKNLHTALQVFSEVLKHVKCKFVVVGEFYKGRYKIIDEETGEYTKKYESGEEYKERIIKLIEKLRIGPYVKFVGRKIGTELQNLYRKAMIYYMPSKSEAAGSVWIEAMASGTPIVAMPKAAVKYIVKDGVVGFLRDSPEEQKRAILRLFTDHKLYKKMQKNCLEEAEKYLEENVAKEWEKVILELPIKGSN
jgi:glycosyltransferase involved in cell wall biosynthesis